MTSFERTVRGTSGAVPARAFMRRTLLSLLMLLSGVAQVHAGDMDTKVPAVSTAAAKPTLLFPRIRGAGGVLPVDGTAQMPSTGAIHRLLVDISDDAATPQGTNRGLDIAARALNLYAMAGVPEGGIRMAILLYGKATPLALSDAAYTRKFGHANHDAKLIAQLHAAGVELFVCGQALGQQGFTAADVRPEVRLALSALTKREELQAAGYGIVP